MTSSRAVQSIRRSTLRLFGILAPGDGATFAIVLVVVLTLAVRVPALPSLADDLAVHVGLLLAYTALIRFALRGWDDTWVAVLRSLAVVGVMFILYSTLGRVPFEAIPYSADPVLAELDRWIFLGTTPALWAERFVTPASTELFSLAYSLFIPYVYMSILLACAGLPEEEREGFVAGFALLYALSFLGYLFVPARGPIVQHAADFQAALPGGPFHRVVVEAIDLMGGPHGAFPSLHVGASAYAFLFDWRRNHLRAMTYFPIVLLITAATVILRYHYVVDLLAGLALAVLAERLARRWQERWRSRMPADSEPVAADAAL